MQGSGPLLFVVLEQGGQDPLLHRRPTHPAAASNPRQAGRIRLVASASAAGIATPEDVAFVEVGGVGRVAAERGAVRREAEEAVGERVAAGVHVACHDRGGAESSVSGVGNRGDDRQGRERRLVLGDWVAVAGWRPGGEGGS